MKPIRLEHLFRAARNEPPLAPGPGFAEQVLRAALRDQPAQPPSLWEQLGAMFPRLALTSATLIVLFLAADLWHSNLEQPDIGSGLAQMSDEGEFSGKGF